MHILIVIFGVSKLSPNRPVYEELVPVKYYKTGVLDRGAMITPCGHLHNVIIGQMYACQKIAESDAMSFRQ